MSSSLGASAGTSVSDSRRPVHQHVWEVVAVDDNDGPARNRQVCACGEEMPD